MPERQKANSLCDNIGHRLCHLARWHTWRISPEGLLLVPPTWRLQMVWILFNMKETSWPVGFFWLLCFNTPRAKYSSICKDLVFFLLYQTEEFSVSLESGIKRVFGISKASNTKNLDALQPQWTVKTLYSPKERDRRCFCLGASYSELLFVFCRVASQQWRKLTQQAVKTATNVYPLGYVLWREFPTQKE